MNTTTRWTETRSVHCYDCGNRVRIAIDWEADRFGAYGHGITFCGYCEAPIEVESDASGNIDTDWY